MKVKPSTAPAVDTDPVVYNVTKNHCNDIIILQLTTLAKLRGFCSLNFVLKLNISISYVRIYIMDNHDSRYYGRSGRTRTDGSHRMKVVHWPLCYASILKHTYTFSQRWWRVRNYPYYIRIKCALIWSG